jgi:uncharacterized OsmC-like protein
LGGLRTEAIHLKSGKTIITDAPIDNNGKGEAFSPTDLMSASLASCMMTIMGITAQSKEIELGEMEVEITKIMGSDPRRVIGIDLNFSVPDLNYDDKTKQILKNAAFTCPVAKSIHPDIEVKTTFNWI